MRLMLRFTIPVERGNEAAKDGTLGAAIQALIERTKPEAAYFTLRDGERGGMIVRADSLDRRLIVVEIALR